MNDKDFASGLEKLLMEKERECWAQNDEITTLRQQLKDSQARCAELRAALVEAADSYDGEFGRGIPEAWQRAIDGANPEPFILRAQADAVDDVNRKLTKISEETESKMMNAGLVMQYAASTAGEEAQRLRIQAGEIERGGSDEMHSKG